MSITSAPSPGTERIDWSQLWYPGPRRVFTDAELARAGRDRPSRTLLVMAGITAALTAETLLQRAPAAELPRLGALLLASAFGAYRLMTALDVVKRWDAELGGNEAAQYREEGVPDLLFETAAAVDPAASRHRPPAYRCPNGALADLVEVFNGRPLFDPAALTMPVLAIRGDDDVTSTDADARRLLALIGSPDKRYRVITPGSHFLCVERNRGKLYDELDAFLAPT